MNTRDLIELAVLDALGMLDQAEAEAFDAAFRAAPPAIQARVREEQARMANLEDLLPNVRPDPALRQRVVTAVREAMLARAVADAAERDDLADGPLALRQSRGVSRAWRIGAIAAAAAAVAFGVAFGHATMRYNNLNQRFESNLAVEGAIQAYGPETMEMMLRPHVAKAVQFTPVDPQSPIEVNIRYLDERGLGFIHCGRLPTEPGVEYALVHVNDNGQIGRTIRQFAATGPLTIQRLENLTLENGMKLALVSVNLATGSKQIMATATVTL
ncbi:MAG: hypothetical protein KatS3mg103_0803 [Phycisphaerales bacterium]|nr:MAG: hypothetical protein KatS3mg103_0803 [Phycisphaerales bacterium]